MPVAVHVQLRAVGDHVAVTGQYRDNSSVHRDSVEVITTHIRQWSTTNERAATTVRRQSSAALRHR